VNDRQPQPGEQPGPDRIRASDADRDRVADVLREALAEGRLTAEEHAERIEQVYASRTLGDLVPITSDLPVHRLEARLGRQPAAGEQSRPEVPPAARTAPAGPPLVAVFSDVKRTGRWRVGPATSTWAVFGAVRIDLTEAVLTDPVITVRAVSIFGSINIDVPEHMDVYGGGFAVFGARNMPGETGSAGELPAGDTGAGGGGFPPRPAVQVTGFSVCGDCNVRRKKRKRR
jgi:hypothetical protein